MVLRSAERGKKIFGWLVGISLLGLIVLPGSAQAAFIDPATFLPNATQLLIKFADFETFISGNGQQLTGIFTVTSISNAVNPAIIYWSAGQGGAELNGRFDNLLSQNFSGTGVNFAGGTFTVFASQAGSFQPGAGGGPPTNQNAQLCSANAGGVCGPAWLTANFVPGIFDTPGSTVTLASTFQTTNPQTGKGSGYLGVTPGGTQSAAFDTNGFTFTNFPAADIFLNTDFFACTIVVGPCANGWPVISQDPALARRVPMPATLLLLGLGVLGVALKTSRIRFNP